MLNKHILLFLFILISLSCWKLTGSHVCNNPLPHISEIVTGITSEPLPLHIRRKRSLSPNLRIYFDYQSSFTNYSNADGLKTTIMEPARNILQSIIFPKAQNTGLLLVDRPCQRSSYRKNTNNIKGCTIGCDQATCLSFPVPDKYLKKCVTMDTNGNVAESGSQGSGTADADIVLLVTYIPCGGITLAYAGSCFSEATLDRPILGVINLCSDKIQFNTRVKENIKVITHEIIHALGFSVDKYAFYRYPNGDPIVPRNAFGYPSLGVVSSSYYMWNDKIITTISRSRTSVTSSYQLQFNGFVLPNVLTAARNHFNCPTLATVDIENYGTNNDGSALSHFDEYFLYNELMTPVSNNGIDFLSNMTLALLHDTGWYTVDYSSVGNLDYGYKKGCILPENGCYKYMKSQESQSQSLDPFCNVPFNRGRTLGCSSFRDYFYLCNLNKVDGLNSIYQYFTSLAGVAPSDVQYYSGSSPYNEYCPTYLVLTDPSFVCNNELNNNVPNLYNVVPSYFGPDSMCFSNNIQNPSPASFYGASCQKYTINTLTNGYVVYIGNSVFSCPSPTRQTYTLNDGSSVTFLCPGDNLAQVSGVINIKTKSVKTSMILCSLIMAFKLMDFNGIFY